MPSSADGLRLARVRTARVARHEAWFRARYLHPDEERLAAALPVDKRRVDFVAGRVAAKRALACAATEVAVLPDVAPREGAPRVVGAPARALSISHGGGWACAAVIDRGGIGVDIERIEARHPAFADEAFAPGELAPWIRALGDGPAAVTLAWCAKEALLKRSGEGLRASLHERAVRAIAWTTPPRSSRGRFGADALCWARIATDVGAATLGVWLDDTTALALALDR